MLSGFGHDAGRSPKGIKPHLNLELRVGWRFDSDQRTFISDDGRQFSPMKDLPKGSRIVYKTPELAQASPESLSQEERSLARGLQVILPKGKDPAAYLALVRKWVCVLEAQLPREISLP